MAKSVGMQVNPEYDSDQLLYVGPMTIEPFEGDFNPTHIDWRPFTGINDPQRFTEICSKAIEETLSPVPKKEA